MPFINEHISGRDVIRYDIDSIDAANAGGTNARAWTISDARDMYLRLMDIGGGSDVDLRNQMRFSFYWYGDLYTLRLDLVASGGERGAAGWSHWRLVRVNGRASVPESVEGRKDQFIADLKDALLAFKDFGVYSTSTDYRLIFDLDAGFLL